MYKKIFFYVPAFCDKFRLDTCMSFCIKDCSRSLSSFLLKNKYVYVNGFIKKSSYNVSRNELIEFFLFLDKMNFGPDCDFGTKYVDVDILYEDSGFVVINKPTGIVVSSFSDHVTNNIINIMLFRYPDSVFIKKNVRHGVIHRLDKDTSGLLLFAKNKKFMENILFQFKIRTAYKQYIAIIYGVPKKKRGIVKLGIGRHKKNRKKMSTISLKLRSAQTMWELSETFGTFASILKVTIKTGRTHQIRVHCKAMGHPIIGDQLYGVKAKCEKIFKIKRQMLHSQKIEITHPQTKKRIKFESPLPDDMLRLIKILRNMKN